MSTSGPRYHIPFPRTFLTLNAREKKTCNNNNDSVVSATTGTIAHSFLSNRPAPRTSSFSSDTASEPSIVSPPASPEAKPVASSALERKAPAFLQLNSKFTPPPTTHTELKFGTGGFLSNRN
ncbi:uncharacterized protein EI97DRAFT_166335 [Westerdykella ornata]|uniref:Uncharacterized protein n=1 Tax=Westerdykella ornata TaxID=318751 RepID=A0A6A6JST9_WESOR|nr:uncharacterized protein EI97DRAFT_166335 [Westerdykella ornata]KAF2279173.1 hypothetical protein EI97DRAFT_166335 [Westerdykella ornata]